MQAKETIPIVLASDANYALYLYTTIVSCLSSKEEETVYSFFLMIDSSFPESYKKVFMDIETEYQGCCIQFVDMKNAFDSVPLSIRHISTPTYYRLLIASTLSEYDKAIYMDTDVIVRKDLREFYSTDLNDCYLGGVVAPAYILNKQNRAYYAEHGVDDLSSYINAGVTLWNLKKIRDDDKEKELCELAKLGLRSQDQDVVNIAFYKRIKLLPLKYNFMTKYVEKLRQKKLENVYNEAFGKNNIQEALDEPVIIHFADKVKPWQSLSVPYGEWWWKTVYSCSQACQKLFSVYSSGGIARSVADMHLQLLRCQKILNISNQADGGMNIALEARLNYPILLREYRKLKLKTMFSWGEKHKVNKKRMKKMKRALTTCKKLASTNIDAFIRRIS